MSVENKFCSIDIVTVDTQLHSEDCIQLPICQWHQEQMEQKLVGKYIAIDKPFEKQIVAARIDLQQYDYETYIKNVKKIYKGNCVRDAKKAYRKGYVCKPFMQQLFIPDIVEINHSKEIRCGRLMTEPYRRSVEEMGGYPKEFIQFLWPECPIHYDLWWGVFKTQKGYKQGTVCTNEKLLGYIRLRRNGNYALYGQILGHGDYLKDGIMYYLHFNILEWLLERENKHTKGLDHLIYAGYYQGKEGLIQWKKKLLFQPAYMVIEQR